MHALAPCVQEPSVSLAVAGSLGRSMPARIPWKLCLYEGETVDGGRPLRYRVRGTDLGVISMLTPEEEVE